MAKQVLITGASSGIGEATARYLSGQGNTVILVSRRKEKLKKIVEELPSKGYYFPYDLQNLEEMESVFCFCKDQGLKLDSMVYCAGINRDVPVKANIISDMKEVMNVNYMAFVEAGKYFGKKKYSNDGASVVAISALGAKICSPGMCTYVASKSALNAAVQVMAKEYMKRGIRINAILPGYVDTEMVKDIDDYIGSLDDRVKSVQPLGIIEPLHVAYLIEFLLSDKSKYITGANIPISGGMNF